MNISRETRLDPVQHEIVELKLGKDDLEALKEFIDGKNLIPNLTNETSKEVLLNRLDAIDSAGIISKLTDMFREHILGKYFVNGHLEVRAYIALRSEGSQGYSEKYEQLEETTEVTYTAIVPLSRQGEDYVGGLLYYLDGENELFIDPGYASIHRNEPQNSWKIANVISGTRLDLLLVQMERRTGVTYEGFSIDPYIDDGSEF
jgi:hypothetical protein